MAEWMPKVGDWAAVKVLHVDPPTPDDDLPIGVDAHDGYGPYWLPDRILHPLPAAPPEVMAVVEAVGEWVDGRWGPHSPQQPPTNPALLSIWVRFNAYRATLAPADPVAELEAAWKQLCEEIGANHTASFGAEERMRAAIARLREGRG